MLGELFRSSDRLKLNAAVLVELTEELDVLKSRGMHEGSENVDGKIEQMSDDENENKYDYSEHRRAAHRAEYIYHLRDNSRRKSEREYSRVGQEIGRVVDKIVKSEKSLKELHKNILLFSAVSQHYKRDTRDSHPHTDRGD